MTWDEALRRISNGEQVQDVLDQKGVEDREAFRSFLADMGGNAADALKRYDQAMRDFDTGIMGARGTWHALSQAQRRVLIALGEGRWLEWAKWSMKRYDVHGPACLERARVSSFCGIATVRNLERRGLVAWEGGAFEPESKAVITERGTFVLRHGRDA